MISFYLFSLIFLAEIILSSVLQLLPVLCGLLGRNQRTDPVLSSGAAILLSWFLRVVDVQQKPERTCQLKVEEMLTQLIMAEPDSADCEIALLISQTWVDRLCCSPRDVSACGHLLEVLCSEPGHEQLLRRLLIFSTIKFLIQSCADSMAEHRSGE